MSDIAAGVLKQQLATIEHTRAEGKWLTRQQVADVQDNYTPCVDWFADAHQSA